MNVGTDLLPCQNDAYLREGTGVVVSCEATGAGVFEAVVDKTLFYPEGGGQPPDHGWLGQARVTDVQRSDGLVRHRLDRAVAVGEAPMRLDWDRRFDHMQQHTAQHLLTAVFEDQHNASTTSFHLGAEICAIELNVNPLEERVLVEVERVANVAIRQALPVAAQVVVASEMASLSGLRSRGLPDGVVGPVRLVSIEGVDLNTCGGTHVANTTELQVIKLLKVEAARGGCRVSFIAGGRALTFMQDALDRTGELNRLLNCGPASHSAAVLKIIDDRKQAQRRISELLSDAASAVALALHQREADVLHHHRQGADMGYLRKVASELQGLGEARVTLLSAGDSDSVGVFLLVGPHDAVARLGPKVADQLGGRGGGAKGRFQGKVTRLQGLEECVRWLQEAVCL